MAVSATSCCNRSLCQPPYDPIRERLGFGFDTDTNMRQNRRRKSAEEQIRVRNEEAWFSEQGRFSPPPLALNYSLRVYDSKSFTILHSLYYSQYSGGLDWDMIGEKRDTWLQAVAMVVFALRILRAALSKTERRARAVSQGTCASVVFALNGKA